MATSFCIEPGYAYGTENIAEIDQILEIAQSITKNELRKKAIEYGIESYHCETGSTLEDYLCSYDVIPSEDLTIWIMDNTLIQTASGGGNSRIMKEILRRAFAILVIDKCFSLGLAVNLILA